MESTLIPNLSSAAALRYQARCGPHAIALRHGDETVTFQQLADRVARLAAGGVRFGDRIAYAMGERAGSRRPYRNGAIRRC
jgi:hypothetical protein